MGHIIILIGMIPTALTIAGSDPSGGAGIQADIKTFSALNVYGMAVITALTAQNTTGVRGVMQVPADFVEAQLAAVVSDISPDAVKIGMLANAAIAGIVARQIREHGAGRVVIDPVMASSSGTPLLDESGVAVLKRELLPLSLLVTPNADEAAALAGIDVRDTAGMEEAARLLHRLGARNVLVKGGHIEGDAVDVFFDGKSLEHLSAPRIATKDLHGTGCVLSSAIAAHLAHGYSVRESVLRSKTFVSDSIQRSLRLGRGAGPVNTLPHRSN